MSRLRVLICDDAVMYATLLSHWFADDPEIEVVGTVSNAKEALPAVESLEPDVVLLDHMLPDALSAELAPELRRRAPGVRIVLASGLPDDALAQAATAIDAQAWVSKASTQSAVREALLAPPPAGA
jgi:DNA-binding NarL/FixJ family response regulator